LTITAFAWAITHGFKAFGTNGGELKSNVVVTPIANATAVVNVILDSTHYSEIQNVGFVLNALAIRVWYFFPVIITTIAIVSTIFKLIFIAITAL
jgi:hypothetical protein